MTYVMDMIIAGVLLVVSICLIPKEYGNIWSRLCSSP